MTKKKAQNLLEKYKHDTGYFSGECSEWLMYDMLRTRMKFGEAEATVIMAALVLAGAKFN